MTLIIAWVGADCKKEGKKIASVYLASDSMYSWPNGGVYNQGQKVFGSVKYPELFSFCGDVFFLVGVFSTLITGIDQEMHFNQSANAAVKSRVIFEYINAALLEYPKECMGGGFSVLYATRVKGEFSLFVYTYEKNKLLTMEPLSFQNKSGKVYSGGSAKEAFDRNWSTLNHSRKNNSGTSRAVYNCLSVTIKQNGACGIGGCPQIMGLYRKGGGRFFGVVSGSKRFVLGMEFLDGMDSSQIEWRNDNFERIDAETMKKIDGAQAQPF